MPCMCGDLMCRSCGPAQGNYRCEVCGKWSSDGGCDDLAACQEQMLNQEKEERAFMASQYPNGWYGNFGGGQE